MRSASVEPFSVVKEHGVGSVIPCQMMLTSQFGDLTWVCQSVWKKMYLLIKNQDSCALEMVITFVLDFNVMHASL
jgi:hypothetical protein